VEEHQRGGAGLEVEEQQGAERMRQEKEKKKRRSSPSDFYCSGFKGEIPHSP
jgi:hypothetical protein